MKLYDWDFAPNCRRVRMFPFGEGSSTIPREECITRDIALKTGYIGHYKRCNGCRCSSWTTALELGVKRFRSGSILILFTPIFAVMGTTALEKVRLSAPGSVGAYDEGMVGKFTPEIFRNSHPQFVDRGLPGHVDPVPQIPALVERGKLRVGP